MPRKEKNEKQTVLKTAKAVKIFFGTVLLLLGLGICAVLIFVGVRLWDVFSPLFGR